MYKLLINLNRNGSPNLLIKTDTQISESYFTPRGLLYDARYTLRTWLSGFDNSFDRATYIKVLYECDTTEQMDEYLLDSDKMEKDIYKMKVLTELVK